VWIDDECEFVDVWMWHHNTVRCIDAFLNSCLRPRWQLEGKIYWPPPLPRDFLFFILSIEVCQEIVTIPLHF